MQAAAQGLIEEMTLVGKVIGLLADIADLDRERSTLPVGGAARGAVLDRLILRKSREVDDARDRIAVLHAFAAGAASR